jgi:hypothetical protein
MSLVLVLGVVSMAMAIAYTALRTQTTSSMVQGNSTRQATARQAANAGISAGLRVMHTADWNGVGTTLAGNLTNYDSYSVAFTPGDASLSPDHADWGDYPYRVTLVSTGYATDPANPKVRASHQVRAVVQLVPKKLSTAPENWPSLQENTIHQWGNRTVHIDLPFRAEGPVLLQGPLSLFRDYPYVSKPFDGEIDEVAIFSKALSAETIKDISKAGSDTLALLYKSNGPLAWWRFDESSGAQTAVDVIGRYDGTFHGATITKPGLFGNAAAFDGINDFVDVGKIDVSGSAMTILAWFKVDDFDYNDGRIISKATSPDSNDHYWMLSTISSGGKYHLRFRLKTGTKTQTLMADKDDLKAGKWYFAAAVYDGKEMKLYADGNEVGSAARGGSIATNSEVPVYIGDNPPGSTRARYLRDLADMADDTGGDTGGDKEGDHRTFTGPINLPLSRSSELDQSLLRDDLRVTVHDVTATDEAPLAHPHDAVLTYQLFNGGKVYHAETISHSYLSSKTLEPDMVNNPLGIFYRSGALTLGNDVTIRGSLIVNGSSWVPDLYLDGKNINLSPSSIPKLNGSSQQIELPVALVRDDFRVRDNTNSTVKGLVLAGDDFEIQSGTASDTFELEGRLFTKELLVRERSDWDQSASWWRSRANEFLAQVGKDSSSRFFPRWLEQQRHFAVEPKIRIKPAANPVSYHWHDWDSPLFVPADGDAGLRWDLIEWTDNS